MKLVPEKLKTAYTQLLIDRITKPGTVRIRSLSYIILMLITNVMFEPAKVVH